MAPLDPLALIHAQLKQSAEVTRKTAEACAPGIARAAELLIDTFRGGGRLLLCGNGGSAADCQHLAAEFVNGLDPRMPRPALGALALTTDTSFLTANANDFGFDHVFERQVEAQGRKGDALLAITTSGNSVNVLRALERSRVQGMVSVLLTGEGGGKAAGLSDVAIKVPSGDAQRIQECHITIGHILCELVERQLFPASGRS